MEKEIILEKSKNRPGMYYDHDLSLLIIEGRSIPENPESVYLPLRNWVEKYFRDSEELNMKIVLEYINSGSSKQLLEALKLLKSFQDKGKRIIIVWLYEEDDEAIMELGEQFRDSSGIPMEIKMFIE